jgi:hypothetical protein
MAIAINGSHMSVRQEELIRGSKAGTVVVLLDPDQNIVAWTTAKRLSAQKEVYVATLKDGDPNEVPKHVLYKTLTNATPYSNTEFLKNIMLLKLPKVK